MVTNSLVCPNCGGDITDNGSDYGTCAYCGGKVRLRGNVSPGTPPSVSPTAPPSSGEVQSASSDRGAGPNSQLPLSRDGVLITGEKSTFLAVILSFIIPGAGIMYAGRVMHGVVVLIASVLTFWILIGFLVWLYGIVKAYSLCEEDNKLWYAYLNSR